MSRKSVEQKPSETALFAALRRTIGLKMVDYLDKEEIERRYWMKMGL